jgi:hypothetical protein
MPPRRRLPALVDEDFPLRAALEAAEPKPPVSASREDKHAYAMVLSRALASTIARALRPRFPAVIPTEDDVGHESLTRGDTGRKRVDVKVWDDDLGLVLLVSLKAYSFRDWSAKKQQASRYTKNIKRNDFELQAEASTIHKRQPYAVMVAIMFMPWTACDDGNPARGEKGLSSFAHDVLILRRRAGRTQHTDPPELFERVYVALYEYDDALARGAVRFFDVTTAPPMTGRPARTLSLDEVLDEIEALTDRRNRDTIEWGESLDDLVATAGETAAEDEE